MEIFDNVSRIVRDDLTETIKPHSRISIAAACFSIYAYQELKKQLSSVDQCRFIFTSPTFVTEKTAKEKREFYIPRLNRERSLADETRGPNALCLAISPRMKALGIKNRCRLSDIPKNVKYIIAPPRIFFYF